MLNSNEKQIEYLQDNLSSIRKIAGWTAEDLGKKNRYYKTDNK